jgi:hypothetical protein
MTSHQFARQLLCEPDLPITIAGDWGDLLDITFTKIEACHQSDEDLPLEEVIVVDRVVRR